MNKGTAEAQDFQQEPEGWGSGRGWLRGDHYHWVNNVEPGREDAYRGAFLQLGVH